MAQAENSSSLKNEFCAFVDEMSGGIPPLGVKESVGNYAVIGAVGPILADRVRFSTLVDDAASEGAAQTWFIRTISTSYMGRRKEQLLHRRQGIAFWDPVAQAYVEEQYEGTQEPEADAEAAQSVVAGSMRYLISLRDSGRLQALDAAD